VKVDNSSITTLKPGITNLLQEDTASFQQVLLFRKGAILPEVMKLYG